MAIIDKNHPAFESLNTAVETKATRDRLYPTLRQEYTDAPVEGLVAPDGATPDRVQSIDSWFATRGLVKDVDYLLKVVEVDNAEEGEAPQLEKVVVIKRLTDKKLGPDPVRGRARASQDAPEPRADQVSDTKPTKAPAKRGK